MVGQLAPSGDGVEAGITHGRDEEHYPRIRGTRHCGHPCKGVVHLAEDPGRRYVFQQVGPRWSLEPDRDWPPDPPRTVLVVIGRPGATTVASLERLLAGVPPVRN